MNWTTCPKEARELSSSWPSVDQEGPRNRGYRERSADHLVYWTFVYFGLGMSSGGGSHDLKDYKARFPPYSSQSEQADLAPASSCQKNSHSINICCKKRMKKGTCKTILFIGLAVALKAIKTTTEKCKI